MHNELTKNDIKKMEDEIEYRVQVVRKQALEDVKEARAQLFLILLMGYAVVKTGLLKADRKSTRLNSSHTQKSRMPSSA